MPPPQLPICSWVVARRHRLTVGDVRSGEEGREAGRDVVGVPALLTALSIVDHRRQPSSLTSSPARSAAGIAADGIVMPPPPPQVPSWVVASHRHLQGISALNSTDPRSHHRGSSSSSPFIFALAAVLDDRSTPQDNQVAWFTRPNRASQCLNRRLLQWPLIAYSTAAIVGWNVHPIKLFNPLKGKKKRKGLLLSLLLTPSRSRRRRRPQKKILDRAGGDVGGMDQIMNKVGSYWLNKKANKEISSVGDDINSLSSSIEGGAKWLVNKLKGKMQKALPELLREYDLPIGLFPQDATHYEFNEVTRKLTVFIPSICEVGYKDSSVLRFFTTVTGYLEKGKLAEIEGIKTKVMIWSRVTSISTEGWKIHFATGVKKTRSRDVYEVVRGSIAVDKF